MSVTVTVTQAEVDALVAAMAAGVLTVTYQGRTVTYASFADLQNRLTWLQNAAAGTSRPAVVFLRRQREC